MSKTVTSTIAYQITGDGYSGPAYSQQTVNTSGVVPGSITLAAGNNTITIPATAVGVTIVPPVGSTNAKTLKGVNGDTGFALAPAVPLSLPLTPGAVASIVINSAGAETLALNWQ